MQERLQITFSNFPVSRSAEHLVRMMARRLENFFHCIVQCRVILGMRRHRHRLGNLYDVQLDIQVPGTTFAIAPPHRGDHARECLDVAIRDAFAAAQRRLRNHMETPGGAAAGRTITNLEPR